VSFVPAIGFPRRLRARGATVSRLRVQETALAVSLGPVAVVLAYILVRRSATPAFALVLVPAVVWLLTRSYGGLALGLALVLVLPYWMTIGAAQGSVLRLASAAAIVGVLVGRPLKPKPTDYALGVYVAITILGWLLQYNAPHAGHVVSIELTPLAFYVGARALPGDRVQLVMRLILFAGTIGALTVIYEYAVGQTVFLDPTAYAWKATSATIFRPGGIFGSPPGASTVLCFVILFGVGAWRTAQGKVRLVAGGCLAVCGLALLLTYTRAAFIAMAVAIVVFLWLLRSPMLSPSRLVVFALSVAILLLIALPRLESSSVFQQGIVRPGQLSAREGYWSLALPIVTSNPHTLVFGVGTAALETPAISSTAPVATHLAGTPQVFTNSLHSQYVTTLVEQGVVGLLALCVFLLIPAMTAGRSARATGDPRYAALTASIAALAVIMVADTALLHGPTFAMTMLTAGLAANATP
jgi:O-antigen ligase